MNLMDPDDDSDFDIGWTPAPPEQHARRVAETDAWWAQRQAKPRLKAIIELEGPGVEGLTDAENMLMMADWPPERGVTSGEYTCPDLNVTCRWRVEPV
jgi:hypothetical protein